MGLIAAFALLCLLVRSLVQTVEGQRAVARRLDCHVKINTLVSMLHIFHSANGSFPPGTIPNPQLPPERRLGWVGEAWPYGMGGAIHVVNRSKGWDEPPNWPPRVVAAPGVVYVGTTPGDNAQVMTCPEAPASARGARPRPLSYVGIAGLG